MLFTSTCHDFFSSRCPPIVSAEPDTSCAEHFRKMMKKQFHEVESILAAEFEQVVAECLELQCQNDALRTQMNIRFNSKQWFYPKAKWLPPPPPLLHQKAARSRSLPSHPGDDDLAELLGAEHLQMKPPFSSYAFGRRKDKKCSLDQQDIFLAVGDGIRPVPDGLQADSSSQEPPACEEARPCKLVTCLTDHSLSSSSKQSNHSKISTGTHYYDKAPTSAFVINVRRLIDMQQLLSLLHELLKSTAIAAITLVSAGSIRQFCCTMVFMICVLILFSMHEADWDRLDVEDVKQLLPLLCDDQDPSYDGEIPNRIFKAVTVSKSRVGRWIWRLWHLFLAALAIMGWITLEHYWREYQEEDCGRKLAAIGDEQHWQGFAQYWAELLIQDVEDAMSMAMQLMVGSFMYLLEVLFAYIHWRETVAVMPKTSSNEAWDPRCHGVPMQYWLMGLPSMWFTCTETWQKLKLYIDMANPGGRAVSIYPQEFAYYALSGDDEREELRKAFRDAKLFDGCKQCIVTDDLGAAKALNVDLCFFDSKRQRACFPYAGDFQYFVDRDSDDAPGSPSKANSRICSMTLAPSQSSRSTRSMVKKTVRRVISGLSGVN